MEKIEVAEGSSSEVPASSPAVKQAQIHDILFNREIGWQDIIYDLINTEQLDPWNINITILADKYLETLAKFEDADFFISSKVLLAASLLLRIKSEILLNKYIRSIDEILFGGKADKKIGLERIELDEEIPALMPRSPIPRLKRVTLKELMDSLNKAVVTENRRIKREIVNRNALREVGISLPKKTISIKDRIKQIYSRLVVYFENEKEAKKVSFTELTGGEKEQRISSFYPLLQLDCQKKIWLDQKDHFEEIYIWLKDVYFKNNPDPFEGLRDELEKEIEELESEDSEFRERVEEINENFENPIGDMFD